MHNWLRKVSALLVVTVLLLAYSVSAAATVQYETITAPRVRDGGVRELGSVLIRMQPLLDLEHVVWVSLPAGFTIEEVSVTRADYNGTALSFEIDGMPGPAPVPAEPDADGFLLSISAQGEISEEVLIILSFDQVDVPENFRGDIMVSFEGLEGQFTSGTARSALVPSRPDEEPEEVEEPEEPEEPEPPEVPEPPVEPEPPEVPVDRGASAVRMSIGSTIIMVDGVAQEIDAVPFIEEDRTFVPVRFLAEAFAAQADWEPKDAPVETIYLTRDDIEITINIGRYYIQILENGTFRTVQSDVPALIKDGRTFLPFRVIAEAFGASVFYGPEIGPVEWVTFVQ